MSKIRPQKERKWPKFDWKSWKLYQKFREFLTVTKKFEVLQSALKKTITDINIKLLDSRQIFGLSTYVKNIPEILYRNFWFSQYNFPKLYRILKLLPEPTALIYTSHLCTLRLVLVVPWPVFLNRWAATHKCAVDFLGVFRQFIKKHKKFLKQYYFGLF